VGHAVCEIGVNRTPIDRVQFVEVYPLSRRCVKPPVGWDVLARLCTVWPVAWVEQPRTQLFCSSFVFSVCSPLLCSSPRWRGGCQCFASSTGAGCCAPSRGVPGHDAPLAVWCTRRVVEGSALPVLDGLTWAYATLAAPGGPLALAAPQQDPRRRPRPASSAPPPTVRWC